MSVTLVADSPAAAAANTSALEAATGDSPFPAGTVYVNPNPVIPGNVTFRGGRIESAATTGDYIARSALTARPGPTGTACLSWRGDETPGARGDILPAGQVGWHFLGDDQDFTPALPTRILPGQAIPSTLSFMRAYSGVPFRRGKITFTLASGHGIVAGETVFATDGPRINECTGEFRQVVSVSGNTVRLDRPLLRTYRQGTFVRGAFPTDIAVKQMTVRGNWSSMFFQQSARITLEDINILLTPNGSNSAPEWLSFVGCGQVTASRISSAVNLGMSSSGGHVFTEITAPGISAEQGATHIQVGHSRLGYLDTSGECTHWNVYANEFTTPFNGDLVLGVYDYWTARNNRCRGLVRVRGRGCRVIGMVADDVVIVEANYSGAPDRAATNVLLAYIDAPTIWLRSGSSGRIISCNANVVWDDEETRARWKRDGQDL